MNQIQVLYKKQRAHIRTKLQEFAHYPEENQLHELIFCLLTPQSKAERCWEAAQLVLKNPKASQEEIAHLLRSRTRFHNNKARYVVQAFASWNTLSQHLTKEKDVLALRNWFAETVNGFGLKESSHFLRNIGRSDNKIAILDRHILKNLVEAHVISSPEVKSQNHYKEIEQKYLVHAQKLKIPADELDLLFWVKEHGVIFK